jgi:hypothetical protein
VLLDRIDFNAGVLRRLFESGDIKLELLTTLRPVRLRGCLSNPKPVGAAPPTKLALNRLLKRYQRIAGDQDRSPEQRTAGAEKAARIERLLGWIGQLLASVPAAGEDKNGQPF